MNHAIRKIAVSVRIGYVGRYSPPIRIGPNEKDETLKNLLQSIMVTGRLRISRFHVFGRVLDLPLRYLKTASMCYIVP